MNIDETKVVIKPVKVKISPETDWELKAIAYKEKVGVSELRGQILKRFVDNYNGK